MNATTLKPTFFLLLLALPAAAFSQGEPHQPLLHLQEVVVSGNAARLQDENVMSVVRLNLAGSAEMRGLSLAQKLAGVAGVSSLSTGAGIGKPVIRGMSGNRIAVFSQGVRVENQQWGDEHGLGLDENGYGQVEIIKGPASLLYGSDALGGVLYFADERYAGDSSLEAALRSEYHAGTRGWRNTGSLKLSKNRWHGSVFGGYTTHEDYADGRAAAVPNSRFRTGDLKAALGYTGRRWRSSLRYSVLREQYGLTEIGDEEEAAAPLAPARERKPALPYQDLATHIVSSENTYFFGSGAKLKATVGYVFNRRKEFEEEEAEAGGGGEAALDMDLATLSYDLKWFSPTLGSRWALTAGTQGMHQSNANKGEERLIPNATTADLGLFAVADCYFSKTAYWQLGLRADGRHVSGAPHGQEGEEGYFPQLSKTYAAFNFSTGVYLPLAERFSLRASLASGYRAPNMFELLSNGVHEGTNRYEIGNPNLQTENSYQADIQLGYKNSHLEVFANPYYSYVLRYVHLQPDGAAVAGAPVYRYAQADAYLYGGEVGFHLHPHPLDWLHAEGSYCNTFGQSRSLGHLPLMPSQKISATLRASVAGKKMVKSFSIYLQEQYSFAQTCTAAHEAPTPAYSLVNAGAALELGFGRQKILLNVAVNNIFSEAYYDHLSRYKQGGIYEQGRNLNVRLSIPFFHAI